MPSVDTVHNPIMLIIALGALSLLPFALIAVTSFVKISVILSILKNALGAGQVPSGAVISVLAFALSFHVMQPVGMQIIARLNGELGSATTVVPIIAPRGNNKDVTVADVVRITNVASEPLMCFLRQHSGMRERLFFASIGNAQGSEVTDSAIIDSSTTNGDTCSSITGESWSSIVPAFLITELHEAFAVGFRILLPFLVLDLVIANVLMGLGMMMVSPVTIALPFKILMFVMCDGWFLLCRSIILAYQV